MKSPCTIDVRTEKAGVLREIREATEPEQAHQVAAHLIRQALDEAQKEALRLEEKFSRFRTGNLVHHINQGASVQLDTEFEQLLNYAKDCHSISNGLFDITSGPLKKSGLFMKGFIFLMIEPFKKRYPL